MGPQPRPAPGAVGLPEQFVPQERLASYVDLAGNPHAEALDAFALGEILGQGPTGLTYDGVRKQDRLRVALKVLNPRFATQPELVAEVREDVLAFVGLDVPGAPLALGVTHGHQVVVYPHLGGQVLTQLLRGGPAEARSALEIVRAVAQVLVPAHEQGLGHGDVRPEKILCGDAGAALCDFGLARASCLASAYGQRGMTFGHPGYLAPEVLQEDQLEPTPVADVYALGITLYQLLCGRPPFTGSVEEVLGRHLDASLPPPPDGVQISKGIAQLLLNLTAKSPTARLRNARTVVDAVDALLQGHRGIVTREAWSVASQAEADQALWASTEGAPLAEQLPDLSDALMHSSARLPREVISDLLQEEARAKDKAADKGKFNLGEQIGRGPIGRTCEGSLGDRPVAVKVISARFDQHPQVVQNLLDRAVASQVLDHPNLVRFVQVIRAKNRTLILQERVQGVPLAQLLQDQGKLEPGQALGFAREIAEALAHAHEHGLAHGDVRPQKIYVEAGRARLADMGYAQANCLGAGFGRHGLPFGHPNYTAPEVFQTPLEAPDPLSDIYGLGVTLYEAICGKPPFEGEPPDVMRKHLSRPIPPPPAEAEVPEAVAELILKLTAKDRARRPQSAQEVLEALDRAAKQASQGAGAPMVEEFDPTQDLLSQADWGQLVAAVPKVTGRWSKDRIKQAQTVGPKDWDERSLAEGSAEQSELRKALEAAVADSASKPGARRGPAPVLGAPPPAGNTATFALSVAGIAVVIVTMIGIAIYQAVTGEPEPVPVAELPTFEPPPEVQKQRAEEEAFKGQVEQALEEYEEKLGRALERREYKRALALVDALPEKVRESGYAQTRLREAQLQLAAGIAEATARTETSFSKLIQNGALDLAERLLDQDGLPDWGREDATYRKMRQALHREQTLRLAKLEQLEGPRDKPFEVPRLRQELRKYVEGIPIDTALPNGGVAVRYRGDALEALLTRNSKTYNLRVAKLKPAPNGLGMALYLEPKPHEVGILFHKLPLVRPLDATLDFVLDGPLKPFSSVGIVSGFSPESRRAFGMSWGLAPVDARPADGIYNWDASVGTELLEPDVVLRMTYSFSPLANRPTMLTLGGDLLSAGRRREGKTVRVHLSSVQGETAITLRDVKGWVVGLEVRGIFDPEAPGN
ncbi:MAG: protein kinase [Planctomycetota bacterium]